MDGLGKYDARPMQLAQWVGDSAQEKEPSALIEVVCEDPTTLKHTLARIRRSGHDVSLVMRVQEASARRDLLTPDIVLLDARHHMIDGAQVCRQLCSRGEDSGDVLVVLDAGQKHLRSWFVSLGATDCVASGDDPDEIGLRIQVLRSRRAQEARVGVVRADAPSPMVSAICDYLSRHLAEPIGMEDLEQRFRWTRKQLNHQFKREMGSTIFAWYRQRKMNYASELLATRALGVQEIAQILGYASVCNFSTAFRQSQGCSPRAYRRTRQVEPSNLRAAPVPDA